MCPFVCELQDFARNLTEIMREKERMKEKAKEKDKDKKAQQKKKKMSDLERSGPKIGAGAHTHKQVSLTKPRHTNILKNQKVLSLITKTTFLVAEK